MCPFMWCTLKNVHHINGIFPIRDVNHKYYYIHVTNNYRRSAGKWSLNPYVLDIAALPDKPN